MRMPPRFRPHRSERGAALMLIALSMTGVIAVSGVVVDGGHAFAQRRQMQNSADAAALAGARALDRLLPGLETAIWNAVVASASSNGADASQITCRLASDMLVDLGACPTAPTGTAISLRAAASAVRVTVAATKETAFIRVVGAEEFTAHGTATAQIQRLLSGSSPFAICAVETADSRSGGDGQAIPIFLRETNDINPVSIGQQYQLQDPSHSIGCGQGSQWKGLTEDSTATVAVPGPWELQNGTHGSNVYKALIAGNQGCNEWQTNNCLILVPLCHSANPSASMTLFCESFGVFRVVNVPSSSRIDGVFVGGAVATGGEGGGHAETNIARVIKLSE